VVTVTEPVFAPDGTVVAISELETTVKAAALPLKLTPVASVRFVPKMTMADPTWPAVGTVFTNGRSPTARLKIVPTPSPPP
jgi:hypothetical protein